MSAPLLLYFPSGDWYLLGSKPLRAVTSPGEVLTRRQAVPARGLCSQGGWEEGVQEEAEEEDLSEEVEVPVRVCPVFWTRLVSPGERGTWKYIKMEVVI